MSNPLVLAAVTSTICYMLQRAVDQKRPGSVGGPNVTTSHPAKLGGTNLATHSGINVYCFHATPQTTGSVAVLPTRRSDGSLIARPAAALDLHYLISCYGDDEELEPQRLLGVVVSALTSTPIVPRGLVTAAVKHYSDSGAGGGWPFLAKSDLDEAVDLVNLSPTALSLEETSNLWGLFDTPYQLSVTYLASTAVITCESPPKLAPPVLSRKVGVQSIGAPRLDSVSIAGEGAAAVTGADLVLRGSRLPGPGMRIRIGPAELSPAPGVSDTEVRAELTAEVPAGVHAVQMTHRSAPGPDDDPPSRVVASSNAVPLMVRPTVVKVLTGSPTVLTVAPPLRKGQRVTVLLSRRSGGDPDDPSDLAFDLPLVEQASQKDLALPDDALLPGIWLVRVRVDGADSLPELVGKTFGRPELVVAAPPP
ncbi:DUF4255 domain-containing protein [Streptomyces sp. 5.8]|uniref:DUF4255 domain-containing protein n=1 Tax=Streptomyces sp. 5.8 TaxID=3406571 RepID=UPI003BB6AD9E